MLAWKIRHLCHLCARCHLCAAPSTASFRGPAEGRSPEPIAPRLSDQTQRREYGFRARRFAAPRNDGCGLGTATSSMRETSSMRSGVRKLSNRPQNLLKTSAHARLRFDEISFERSEVRYVAGTRQELQ